MKLSILLLASLVVAFPTHPSASIAQQMNRRRDGPGDNDCPKDTQPPSNEENGGAKPKRKESELVFSIESKTAKDGRPCADFALWSVADMPEECVNFVICNCTWWDVPKICDNEIDNIGEITAEKLAAQRPACSAKLICEYSKKRKDKFYAFY